MARLPGRPDAAVVETTVSRTRLHPVDWPAVIAGAVLATAISFVLFTFGAGLGLSITSPYPGRKESRLPHSLSLSRFGSWLCENALADALKYRDAIWLSTIIFA